MFSKKPLQGLTCASCDKNLVNLQGLPADYYNWKKMPSSKERIPMVYFQPDLTDGTRIFKNASVN